VRVFEQRNDKALRNDSNTSNGSGLINHFSALISGINDQQMIISSTCEDSKALDDLLKLN